jgi:hypothetical protein
MNTKGQFEPAGHGKLFAKHFSTVVFSNTRPAHIINDQDPKQNTARTALEYHIAEISRHTIKLDVNSSNFLVFKKTFSKVH